MKSGTRTAPGFGRGAGGSDGETAGPVNCMPARAPRIGSLHVTSQLGDIFVIPLNPLQGDKYHIIKNDIVKFGVRFGHFLAM